MISIIVRCLCTNTKHTHSNIPMSIFDLVTFVYMLSYTLLHVVLQVKTIEKKDSVLTGPQQIDQLLRPGSAYFNLNHHDAVTII